MPVEARWQACWTCPTCGGQRDQMPYDHARERSQGYVHWHCPVCGWCDATADEFATYLDFITERGITPHQLWTDLLARLRAKEEANIKDEVLEALSSTYSLLSLLVHRASIDWEQPYLVTRQEAWQVLGAAERVLRPYWEQQREAANPQEVQRQP